MTPPYRAPYGSLPPEKRTLRPKATLRLDRADETKGRILLAAQLLFSTRFYADVNLRLIAETARLSTGAIFCHFTSKAELYTAATGKPAPEGALQDAAPDLLSLLVKAHGLLRDYMTVAGPIEEEDAYLMNKIGAAIAKAERLPEENEYQDGLAEAVMPGLIESVEGEK